MAKTSELSGGARPFSQKGPSLCFFGKGWAPLVFFPGMEFLLMHSNFTKEEEEEVQ